MYTILIMLPLLKKSLNNKYTKGAFFLTLASFITNFINYLFYLIIGRSLGPDGYGDISALMSYIAILSVPLSVISLYLIQKIASSKIDKYAYVSQLETYFWSKIKKYRFLIIMIGLLTPFLPKITNLNGLISYSILPLLFLSVIGSVYDSFFQGLGLFFVFSFLGVVVILIKLFGGVLTLTNYAGLSTVIIFIIISGVFKSVVNKIILNREIAKKVKNDKRILIQKRIISLLKSRQFILTFLSVIGTVALGNLDIIYAKKFFDSHFAGIYSSWSLFGKIILYVIGPILSISYVFFSDSAYSDEHDRMFLISLGVLFIFGICISLFYLNFSQFVVFIIFGGKFNEVIHRLSLAGLYGILYSAIIYFNNYFLAKKSLVSALLPISLIFYAISLLFIPKNIDSLIMINIQFSSIIVIIYILITIVYFYRFNKQNVYYNT